MTKSLLKKIKEKLESGKTTLERELQRFAKKDEKAEGDWDTKFPKFNGGAGGQQIEDEAEEVEQYASLLPIEYSLETRLKDINLALKKIGKGEYGKCEKCGAAISKERLEVCPEARTCQKCKPR